MIDPPEVAILQAVDVDFVDGRWEVTGGYEGGPIWRGSGDDTQSAMLDWMAARLGLKE